MRGGRRREAGLWHRVIIELDPIICLIALSIFKDCQVKPGNDIVLD